MITVASSDRTFPFRGQEADFDPDNFTEYNGIPIANGSTFITIDTGKIFMYNGETKKWKEWLE